MREVLIVDDELLARRMLKESIVWENYGCRVAWEAQNGKQGLEIAVRCRPDIIFVDIKMPLMDGLEMIKQLSVLGINSKIVMLTCYEDFAYVREAMRYGAVDYLLKHTFEQEDLASLLGRIEKAIRKEEAALESMDLLKGDVLNKIIRHTLTRNDIRGYVDTGVLPTADPKYMILYIKFQKNLSDEEKGSFSHILRYSLEHYLKAAADIYISGIRENEVYTILLCEENAGISEIKSQIQSATAQFSKDMQGMETGWLTGVTYHMFYRWEDLGDALKEVRELVQIDGEYLNCSAKVLMAIEYIRNNYSHQISLEDIAEYVGISRIYLSQLFKKETGKNIRDYLAEYRLSKAKELLLTSNLKIYTISELCGFGSAQYFNRIFKKMTGFSPYQFKDNKMQ
ncbi:MAG TPA: response regulator [Candidatus Mediterraneibacter excrementigallinarum]|mgnify:CR=1 FL=1|nr:response regulator [Candidatus Mediterraneibacter excrementigallinarum]